MHLMWKIMGADAADEAGLDAYTARFHQALSAEKAAIADMD